MFDPDLRKKKKKKSIPHVTLRFTHVTFFPSTLRCRHFLLGFCLSLESFLRKVTLTDLTKMRGLKYITMKLNQHYSIKNLINLY